MIISSCLFPPRIQNYVRMILNILYFPDINFRLDIDFFFILSCTNVSEPPTLLQQREANGINLKHLKKKHFSAHYM